MKRVRFDAAAARVLRASSRPCSPGLPPGGNHWGKYDRPRPGRLALPVDRLDLQRVHRGRAAPRDDRPLASRRHADYETYATGLRNAVGFDWRPADGAMYATDNGRDLLGDDVPPCELDKVEQGKLLRLAVRERHRRRSTRTSARKGGDLVAHRGARRRIAFGAHMAPLGHDASTAARAFPERYRGQAFVGAARLLEPDEEERLQGGAARVEARRARSPSRTS